MNENYTPSYGTEPREKASAGKKSFADSPMFNLVLIGLALFAMILLALANTIGYFVTNLKNENIMRGVFSIFIYALPMIGTALAYLVKRGKISLELFLNIGALFFAFRFL